MGDPPIKSNVHRHPNPPQVLAGRPIIRSIQFLRCDYFSFLRPTLTAELACSSLDSNNNTKWCLIQEEADWLLGRLRELNLKSWAKLIKAEFLTRFLCPIKSSKPINLREDINRKKTFSFGHCPNHLPPPWPQFGQLGPLFLRQKRRFARMTGKKIDADNEGCNDNYDDNYGNFDDNYDKND